MNIFFKSNHNNTGGNNMKNKNKNENEINVLDELNKGTCMGMDAIHFTLDKVEDGDLKEELINQYKEYEKIHNKICELYPEYNREDEPTETSMMNKAMTDRKSVV